MIWTVTNAESSNTKWERTWWCSPGELKLKVSGQAQCYPYRMSPRQRQGKAMPMGHLLHLSHATASPSRAAEGPTLCHARTWRTPTGRSFSKGSTWWQVLSVPHPHGTRANSLGMANHYRKFCSYLKVNSNLKSSYDKTFHRFLKRIYNFWILLWKIHERGIYKNNLQWPYSFQLKEFWRNTPWLQSLVPASNGGTPNPSPFACGTACSGQSVSGKWIRVSILP